MQKRQSLKKAFAIGILIFRAIGTVAPMQHNLPHLCTERRPPRDPNEINEMIDPDLNIFNPHPHDWLRIIYRSSEEPYNDFVALCLMCKHNGIPNIRLNGVRIPLLHFAAKFGKYIPITLLRKFGANLDEQDEDGNTALHHAVMGGHPEIVHYLLKKGANREIRNNQGKTAEEWLQQRFKELKRFIYQFNLAFIQKAVDHDFDLLFMTEVLNHMSVYKDLQRAFNAH